MKFTLPLFVVALIAANIPSLASGQTKSTTPPPPPLTKRSTVRAKSHKGIPPAPPISSIKSVHKLRPSSAAATRYQPPGQDVTGRRDMSAKPVSRYPVAKGGS
jgi:hypothetical protein